MTPSALLEPVSNPAPLAALAAWKPSPADPVQLDAEAILVPEEPNDPMVLESKGLSYDTAQEHVASFRLTGLS